MPNLEQILKWLTGTRIQETHMGDEHYWTMQQVHEQKGEAAKVVEEERRRSAAERKLRTSNFWKSVRASIAHKRVSDIEVLKETEVIYPSEEDIIMPPKNTKS